MAGRNPSWRNAGSSCGWQRSPSPSSASSEARSTEEAPCPALSTARTSSAHTNAHWDRLHSRWPIGSAPIFRAGPMCAVDRDNGALLNDIGQVEPVSPLNGSNNPAPLFFDQRLTPSDLALIRKDDIRYVVTDTRLTEGLPLYGAYIAPGETRNPERLTAAELEKFNSIPGVSRIYDNGAIQVYDVSRLMGKQPLPMLQGSPGESVVGNRRARVGPCLPRLHRLAVQAAPPSETRSDQRARGGLRIGGGDGDRPLRRLCGPAGASASHSSLCPRSPRPVGVGPVATRVETDLSRATSAASWLCRHRHRNRQASAQKQRSRRRSATQRRRAADQSGPHRANEHAVPVDPGRAGLRRSGTLRRGGHLCDRSGPRGPGASCLSCPSALRRSEQPVASVDLGSAAPVSARLEVDALWPRRLVDPTLVEQHLRRPWPSRSTWITPVLTRFSSREEAPSVRLPYPANPEVGSRRQARCKGSVPRPETCRGSWRQCIRLHFGHAQVRWVRRGASRVKARCAGASL